MKDKKNLLNDSELDKVSAGTGANMKNKVVGKGLNGLENLNGISNLNSLENLNILR